MDAHGWNGDVDPREFGPDPDADRCVECGAGALEDCDPCCLCDACIAMRDSAVQRVKEA